MQPERQRRDLRDRVLGPGLGGRVGGPALRRDDLLDQPDLTVRRGLERAQVARLDAELRELLGGRARRPARRCRSDRCPFCAVTRPKSSSWPRSSSGISAILRTSLRDRRRSSWRRNDSGLGMPSGERATSGTDGVRDTSGGGSRPRSIASRISAIRLCGWWWSRCSTQHVAQPLHVGVRVLAVAGRRPLRRDQALLLQEADLGDAEVAELRAQQLEDLPDVHQPGGRLLGARPCGARGQGVCPAKKTSRYFPTWTSSPSVRCTVSMRSRLT